MENKLFKDFHNLESGAQETTVMYITNFEGEKNMRPLDSKSHKYLCREICAQRKLSLEVRPQLVTPNSYSDGVREQFLLYCEGKLNSSKLDDTFLESHAK